MPLSLSIPTPENFSFKECLWFLDRGFDDCLHKVKDGSVTKLLRIRSHGLSLLRISESEDALRVDLLKGEARESEIIDYITE